MLTRLPIEAIREGSAQGVDLLVGTTRDEWRLFAGMDPEILKLDDAKLLLDVEKKVPGADSAGTSHASVLVEAYRKAREGKSGTSPQELFCAIETDRVFRIPAVRLADAQVARGERVYAYLVTWESPLLGGILGACHAIDLPFVFGTVEHAELFAGSGPDAKALEGRTMDAWLAFARDGNPGWEPYDSERRATMFLGRECEVVTAPFEDERRAWDGVID